MKDGTMEVVYGVPCTVSGGTRFVILSIAKDLAKLQWFTSAKPYR
jgi:hypothetical protein